ncbi:MAG: isoprenylcysteine carboxylmethyltransferase family protein [Nitrospiraceae bacterium]|nr:MAG: isoprenylcysteine carboxylmethyltransferase family protein [Nitrospiraceae bacterium]
MTASSITLRQAIVVFSALIYWGGVLIHAHRVRKDIGRSPNLSPRTFKETLLWLSWFFIITGWAGQPFLVERYSDSFLFLFIGEITLRRIGITAGVFLWLCGQAGTLWCYHALGTSWRIGVNRKERTALVQNGPYRFVRHPIYLFQLMILIGVAFILPTAFSLIILLVHTASIFIKARDEEEYLLSVHGSSYKEYYERTGRFLPKWRAKIT